MTLCGRLASMVVWSNLWFGCSGRRWGGRKSLGRLSGRSRYSPVSMEDNDVSVSDSGDDIEESQEEYSDGTGLVDESE